MLATTGYFDGSGANLVHGVARGNEGEARRLHRPVLQRVSALQLMVGSSVRPFSATRAAVTTTLTLNLKMETPFFGSPMADIGWLSWTMMTSTRATLSPHTAGALDLTATSTEIRGGVGPENRCFDKTLTSRPSNFRD